MVAVKLAEKSNYLNKSISYLRNVIIQEYDIKSAGFTVIKSLRLLPEKKISYLETLPKEKRNIKIGLEMKKNPEIAKKVNEILELIRKQFMEANNIPEEAVLSIKKDAIFLINQSPKVLIFGDFEFRAKNRYTSYAYISNKEFFYNSNDNILDVKGLSAESKELSREYFLKDLCRLFRCAERLDSEKLFNVFKNYRSDYLNKRLDRNSYRELDSEKFRIGEHLVDEISEDMLEFVDISQNYINYILKIFNYII